MKRNIGVILLGLVAFAAVAIAGTEKSAPKIQDAELLAAAGIMPAPPDGGVGRVNRATVDEPGAQAGVPKSAAPRSTATTIRMASDEPNGNNNQDGIDEPDGNNNQDGIDEPDGNNNQDGIDEPDGNNNQDGVDEPDGNNNQDGVDEPDGNNNHDGVQELVTAVRTTRVVTRH